MGKYVPEPLQGIKPGSLTARVYSMLRVHEIERAAKPATLAAGFTI